MPIVHNHAAGIFRSLDCLFHVYKEKIPENGEDSFCYGIREDVLLLGAFDGCGGSGAKRYLNYRNKTGAYVAARAAAGAVMTWFARSGPDASAEENAREIRLCIKKALNLCRDKSARQDERKLRGSIAKEFPTTAAIAYCVSRPGAVSVDCFWAGDSRVYILDGDGLAQVTRDDLDGLDAFENISADGVLTNVISASKPFEVHSSRLIMRRPFLVFAASDGCFGYIPTPMEFEAYLIERLLKSESIAGFERDINAGLEETAGDDYSLVGAAFGFGTYADLRDSLKPRFQLLMDRYVLRLKGASAERIGELWNDYKANYYRYLAGEESRREKPLSGVDRQ